MAEVVEMPKLSDTMTEGVLVKWLKKEGDAIESGDEIAEIETDKATMPVEAFESGVLLKIVVQEGITAPCNAPIAFIGEKGEKIDDAVIKEAQSAAAASAAPAKEEKAPEPVETKQEASEPVAVSSVSGSNGQGGRVKASPLAKKIARESGVSLVGLEGTGPGGRIVKKDVLAAAASGGGSGWGLHPTGPIAKEERIAVGNMRKTIAKRLVQSKTEFPHFYVEMEINAAPLVELRQSLNEKFSVLPKPFKLSLNDFVLKASAEALRKYPSLNASWEGDAIRQYGNVQLSFGVAIPDGLITPVIAEAQNKSLKSISAEAKKLALLAREGKLKPEQYTGGSFTVSNLGMFGVDRFSAIINPPQAAILAVGGLVKKAVVDDENQVVPGLRMSLVLSCDHRVVDGAPAAQFLQEIKGLLETPALLLL